MCSFSHIYGIYFLTAGGCCPHIDKGFEIVVFSTDTNVLASNGESSTVVPVLMYT